MSNDYIDIGDPYDYSEYLDRVHRVRIGELPESALELDDPHDYSDEYLERPPGATFKLQSDSQ